MSLVHYHEDLNLNEIGDVLTDMEIPGGSGLFWSRCMVGMIAPNFEKGPTLKDNGMSIYSPFSPFKCLI